MKPDWVCVGAQRAGSTWLHRLIQTHPKVSTPRRRKEMHFFDQFGGRAPTIADVARYRQAFPPGVAGETTPRYMFLPWAGPLLAEVNPAMRLLVVLRDPVARSRSALARITHKYRTPTVDDYVEQIDRSRYLPQLERLLRSFTGEQIHVLQYERLVSDPDREMRKVFAHIGVDPVAVPPTVVERRVQPAGGAPPRLPSCYDAVLRADLAADLGGLASLVDEFDAGLWPAAR